MGQRSEPAIWSTCGGLRWSKKGNIKKKNPIIEGIRESGEARKHILHSRTVIVLKSKRNI